MAEGIVRGRGALIALVVVCTSGVIALIAADPTIDPESPAGSSYNTTPDGAAAYAELLQRSGYSVERTRIPLSQRSIPGDDTIVILGGAGLPAEDDAALAEFVRRGGRLIVSGGAVNVVGFAPPLQPEPAATRQVSVFPHPDLRGIEEIAVPGAEGFAVWGSMIPLFGDRDLASVLVAADSGTVFVLVDPLILSNSALGLHDNAALGLAMAGSTARRVHFVEYPHGYMPSQGLGTISGRWRTATYFVVAAGLMWLLAHARRLGPPEVASGAMANPPRSAYVTALATAMSRADNKTGATAGLEAYVRRRVAARTGLDTELTPDEYNAAATSLATRAEDLELALGSAGGSDAVLAVGRVVSDLTRDT